MRPQRRPPVIDDVPITVFRRCDARAAGWTDEQIYACFLRVFHGVYTTPTTPLTHVLKCAAAALTVPEDSVITGRSAPTLRGVDLAGFGDPVEVIVPNPDLMMRRKGLRCSAVRVAEFEHSSWRGVGVAGFPRIAFDLLKQRSITQAVAHCDALLHAGVITADEIAGFLVGRHDHGIRRARLRVPYLDGRAESVPESVLRVEFVLRGMHPVPQLEVFDGDRFVARLDLAFEEAEVAADPAQAEHDRVRRDRLRALGWTVIVVTNDRLRDHVDEVIAEVAAALGGRSGKAA
ncbi:hypothetical protein [Saccharopolyspora sp. NPDC049426]|uniref:endonuclease domain-containing protein n=1 Tax=Saccharopolyspora sp. NPDC049426 TaxID=3155652 RepID=UPI003442D4E6